jgi:hypothetical protein
LCLHWGGICVIGHYRDAISTQESDNTEFVYIIYITFGHFVTYRYDYIIIVPSLDIIGCVPGSYMSLPLYIFTFMS